jgi:hypothetical protein
MARAFAKEGIKVAIADIEPDAAECVAQDVGDVAAHVDTSSLTARCPMRDRGLINVIADSR